MRIEPQTLERVISSYITPVFALAGFALFNLQVLREYYRREVEKSTALDHASKVGQQAAESTDSRVVATSTAVKPSARTRKAA